MEKRPRAFIASSSHTLSIAKNIKSKIECVANSSVWTHDMFKTIDSMDKSSSRGFGYNDFAIFILGQDDITKGEDIDSYKPRDNIVAEMGQFAKSIGRNRMFLVCPNNPHLKLPTNLSNLTTLKYPVHLSGNIGSSFVPVCKQLKNLIKMRSVDSRRKELFINDPDRKFGLYFEDGQQIWPVTVKEFAEYVLENSNDKARDLCLSIYNLIDVLNENPDLKNVDANLLSTEFIFPEKLLARKEKGLSNEDDLDLESTTPLYYLGTITPKVLDVKIVQAWVEMRDICDKMLRKIYQSTYDIILSYYNGKKMTITSHRTSKSNLIPYFNTPIVENIQPEPGSYYGFPETPPSSETRPHWLIHTSISKLNKNNSNALIHCHPQYLRQLYNTTKINKLSKDVILPFITPGTKELGVSLAKVLAKNRSAIIEDHGVWTFGVTFEEAYEKLLELMDNVEQILFA
jgi:ribulose-5-phosphate 4-epimerase/fuculose-1-phosphate aldolase